MTHVHCESHLVLHKGGLRETGVVVWKREALRKGMAIVLKYPEDNQHIHIVTGCHTTTRGGKGRWRLLGGSRFCFIIRRHFLRSRAA